MTFNHRGNLLASMSWDGTVRLWDPIAGKELMTNPGALGDGFPELHFSHDDRWLAFAYKGNVIGLWEVATGQECAPSYSYLEPLKGPWCVDFSPDGRLLASANADGVRLWDVGAAREIAFLPLGYIRTVAFHPSGQSLITCGEDAGVDYWPIERNFGSANAALRIGPPKRVDLPQGSRPLWASLADDGRTLAVADGHGQVIVLNPEHPADKKYIAPLVRGADGPARRPYQGAKHTPAGMPVLRQTDR